MSTSTVSPAPSDQYDLGTSSIFDDDDPSYGTDPLRGDIRPCAVARASHAAASTRKLGRPSRA